MKQTEVYHPMRNAIIAVAIAMAATVQLPSIARDHHWDHKTWDSHNNDWNWQRSQYKNDWHHVSMSHQREYDADLRREWNAYHHGKWNGKYGWNTYNDPAFFDYLHTSNPSLLTRINSAFF